MSQGGVMEMEIELPEEIAVMTLPRVAFFPQVLMPLHIFEPRYRQMLADVLDTHRMFAVAGMSEEVEGGLREPLHRVATVGIIRACQQGEDGTSNLVLQGLVRVQVLEILGEEPYRRVRAKALSSRGEEDKEENERLRRLVVSLGDVKAQLGGEMPGEMLDFLRRVGDADTFADLASFNLCQDAGVKQRLLETLDVGERLQMLGRHLRKEITRLRLKDKLQGGLDDDAIASN